MMSSNGDAPDVIRYQVAIPVNELQVRQNVQDHSERQGMWELVHCRSEKEGRPERVYQYQRYPHFRSVRYQYDGELVHVHVYPQIHEKCYVTLLRFDWF